MPIAHLIAHRIEKAGPNNKTHIQFRDEEMPLNGISEEFSRELRQSYIKKLGKFFGRFSTDPALVFAPLVDEFLTEKIGFSGLTQRLAQHLGSALDGTECVAYGYLVFMLEKLESANSFYIFWVENSGSQFLDGELNLNEQQILDVKALSLGARINISEWKEDASKSYLGVLPRRGDKELTDVVTDWLGFTDKRDVKNETEQFIGAVENYVARMPEEVGMETRAKVVDYCVEQDKTGEAVSMKGLSNHISAENPQHFYEHVNQQCPELEHSLIPDKTQLRNYIRISGRNELMSMSFASDCLGQSVIYDVESDSLIIKNIPSSLKSRLQKHMGRNE